MVKSLALSYPLRMRHAVPARLLGSSLLLVAANAFGLGLGRVSTLSHLGNPLELSVGVSAEASDGLTPECVNAEVFVGDHRLANELVRIRINRAPDGTPISLRLATGARIDEPVATVTLMLGCPASVTRRYVVFIDPPSVNLAQAETGEPVSLPSESPAPVQGRSAQTRPSSGRSRPPPVATAAEPELAGSPTGPSRRSQPRRFDEEGSRVAVQANRSRKRTAPAATATATAQSVSPSTSGARLQLESAPAGQTGSPARGQSAATARGAPAASGATDLAALTAQVTANSLALDQERLRALEDRFNRLRTDNEATKRSLAEVKAGLQAAQNERFDKSVVYALAVAAALLLLALLVALLRLRSHRSRALWSAGDADLQEQEGDAIGASVRAADKSVGPELAGIVDSIPDLTVQHADPGWQTPADAVPTAAVRIREEAPLARHFDERSEFDGYAEPASLDQPQTMPGPAYGIAANAAASGQGASIDELVDLEQQAEFFIVLGQDEAAIELLTAHVQTTGDASPLPYLKLLEIYRRRREETLYTRTRERFNRRFGATAPDWEDPPQAAGSIEDHPRVLERLQSAWPDPADAMQLVESLLFRRDPSIPEFDLATYGELLFLYSIARDLAERVVPRNEVDLLLPLDAEQPVTQSLGFDLALDAAPAEAEHSPSAPVFNLRLLDAPIIPRSIAASTETALELPVLPSQHG